jgi:MHS family proline/betaine transporter-like MFS transporter
MSDYPRTQLPALSSATRRLRTDDCIIVDKRELRKAQIGAGVGNFIEWYDIGIYGYLTLTMTSVFTEGMDQRTGLLVTLLGFAVSFIVRPLGGMILGPLGDRIGRRKVLFFTMAVMASATTLIGVLPTAGQMGLWVIVPLYVLKMLQGFSTGGEYSGAATALLNTGAQLGFAAGAAVVAATTMITTSVWGESAMLDGGWRIPFLLALPLGLVAISLRKRIPESPSFEVAHEKTEWEDVNPLFVRQSLPKIIKLYWPQILVGIALIAADGTSSYTVTSYMPTYLESQVGMAAVTTAVATVVILLLQAIIVPFVARWSDRVGRRPIYVIATVGNLVLLVPAFALMHLGEMWSLYLALFMVSLPSAFFLALTGAVMSELFPTASRYGSVGLTHNVAISLFGGTTPLVSQILVEATGNSYAPAFYVMFFSVVALFALTKMRESAARPLLGSVPVVSSTEEAALLVRDQDTNPHIDTSTMLLTPASGVARESVLN